MRRTRQVFDLPSSSFSVFLPMVFRPSQSTHAEAQHNQIKATHTTDHAQVAQSIRIIEAGGKEKCIRRAENQPFLPERHAFLVFEIQNAVGILLPSRSLPMMNRPPHFQRIMGTVRCVPATMFVGLSPWAGLVVNNPVMTSLPFLPAPIPPA